MITLKAEKREAGVKSKRLRREDYVPGVLYGKHLEASIPVRLPLKETENFLKTNSVGSRLELAIDGEAHVSMLKELAREPATGKLEHLSFMALNKGERVKGVARIAVTGRESAQRGGVVLQTLSEINYRALPTQLVDLITVNIEKLGVNENIKVSDLEIANDPNIELLTSPESVIVTVTPIKKQTEEPKPEAEEAATAGGDTEEKKE